MAVMHGEIKAAAAAQMAPRGPAAARPGRGASICHDANVLLCETERETAGRRLCIFLMG